MQFDYKLSIIIPHYNTPGLLDKLLSTIPDIKDIQTIVIDDGSSDEAKGELQKIKSHYERQNILFLENNSSEHNAGVARNVGLKNATGEWLLFADSDDYFLDGFYKIIQNYFESDYDIVFFCFHSEALDTGDTNIRQSEYCDYIKSFLKNPTQLTEANLRYRWFAPWSKLIKKSFVDSNHITFDSINVSNDVMFSVKTGLAAKKIAASEEEIYCVTKHKGSLTTKYDVATFELRTKVKVHYFRFIKNHLSKEEFREVDAYLIPWTTLSAVLFRGYGIKEFMKHLKIFWDNKMFVFDVRIFTHMNIIRWFAAKRRAGEDQKQYNA